MHPESYIEITNFYTATIYNNGAEVIRMMRTSLGEEAFRRSSSGVPECHLASAERTHSRQPRVTL